MRDGSQFTHPIQLAPCLNKITYINIIVDHLNIFSHSLPLQIIKNTAEHNEYDI